MMVLRPRFPFPSREQAPPGLVHGIKDVKLGPGCWCFVVQFVHGCFQIAGTVSIDTVRLGLMRRTSAEAVFRGTHFCQSIEWT